MGWLEEARVEALAAVGLDYAHLSGRGLELPLVGLRLEYRRALRHGELVELRSLVEPRRGVRLPWRSRFLGADGAVAAEAWVDLVAVELHGEAGRRRVLRHLPDDLAAAVESLHRGPIT